MFLLSLNFDKWQHAKGKYFIWDRLLYKGYRWTPICIIKRIPKTYKEVNIDCLIAAVLYDFAGRLSIAAEEQGAIKDKDEFFKLTAELLQEFLVEREVNTCLDYPTEEIKIEDWEYTRKFLKLYLDDFTKTTD